MKKLPLKGKTRIQELVGVLLYYSRVIDSTITTAVNKPSEQQCSPTEDSNKAVQRFIDYCRKYPNNILIFTACDMILHIQSDVSYLSRHHARSVAGGLYYLGNHGKLTAINNPLDVLCQIIDVIVSSAFEALFLNARHSIYLRNILEDLGYPQPPTVILCDNKCAVGIATDTAQPKRSRAIDMRWHRQGLLDVYWREGYNNLADFYKKYYHMMLIV